MLVDRVLGTFLVLQQREKHLFHGIHVPSSTGTRRGILHCGMPEHAISGKFTSTRLMQVVSTASKSIVPFACISDMLMLSGSILSCRWGMCASCASEDRKKEVESRRTSRLNIGGLRICHPGSRVLVAIAIAFSMLDLTLYSLLLA